MTAKEFNRDFWVVCSTPFLGRTPISFPLFCSLVGTKIHLILRKLEQNKNQKLVIKPFHGETYIIYRH